MPAGAQSMATVASRPLYQCECADFYLIFDQRHFGPAHFCDPGILRIEATNAHDAKTRGGGSFCHGRIVSLVQAIGLVLAC